MRLELLDLVLPGGCAACGRAGAALCERCAGGLRWPRLHRPSPAPPGLPAMAVAGPYAGPARSALLAYKERGRRDLIRPLAVALAATVRFLLAWLLPTRRGPGPPLAVVPVPSTRCAARARGGDHVARLTRSAVTLLVRSGLTAVMVPAVRVRGSPEDSAGLGADARRDNLAGAFAVTRAAADCGGRLVVVVDDLVTTGATVSEISRTLGSVRIPVAGAAAVAGTTRRARSLDG